MCVCTETEGNSSRMWSPIDTIKIARQENSSKYKTIPRRIAPVSPKASLAISGNELMLFRMRIAGSEPDERLLVVSDGDPAKYDKGRGSPFSSLPIKIDVIRQIVAKVTIANTPPRKPEEANANGKQSIPTPINMFDILKTHW